MGEKTTCGNTNRPAIFLGDLRPQGFSFDCMRFLLTKPVGTGSILLKSSILKQNIPGLVLCNILIFINRLYSNWAEVADAPDARWRGLSITLLDTIGSQKKPGKQCKQCNTEENNQHPDPWRSGRYAFLHQGGS